METLMQKPFEIRIARPSDADGISRVLEQAYSILLAPDYDGPELRAALPVISTARPELVASGTYFVAETPKGEIVGAGGWSFHNPVHGAKDGNTAHIRHVAVFPNFIRMGVGGAVMNALFTQSKAFGVKRYECLSTITAVQFYKTFGFRKVEDRVLQLAGGIPFPVSYMVR